MRDFAGRELVLPSWERAMAEDWLGKWAMNLMLLNVSTRKFRRAVRLPEGDVPASAGSGVSKSAASRHFVALSGARLREWLAADLSGLDPLVVQIDGIHISAICQFGNRRITRWSSIPRPPRRSGSKFPRRCSLAPTR